MPRGSRNALSMLANTEFKLEGKITDVTLPNKIIDPIRQPYDIWCFSSVVEDDCSTSISGVSRFMSYLVYYMVWIFVWIELNISSISSICEPSIALGVTIGQKNLLNSSIRTTNKKEKDRRL